MLEEVKFQVGWEQQLVGSAPQCDAQFEFSPKKICRNGSTTKVSPSSVVSTFQWQGAGANLERRDRQDARGVAFESLYVHIVMQACLGERPMDIEVHQPSREQEQARNATGWEVLDDVDWNRCSTVFFLFSNRCPAAYRRRFKQAVRVALDW